MTKQLRDSANYWSTVNRLKARGRLPSHERRGDASKIDLLRDNCMMDFLPNHGLHTDSRRSAALAGDPYRYAV